MRFKVSSSDLYKKLQVGLGAIDSNPVQPILEDFLFVLKGDVLTTTSSNLDTTIRVETEVQGEMDGEIALPAKLLLEILKALPDQPLNFEIDEENNWLEVTSAFGKYRMAGDDPVDFPALPEIEQEHSLTVNSKILSKAIGYTIIGTSDDELKPGLTGVLCLIDFNKLTFVGTDAHKLVKYTYPGIDVDYTKSFLTPKKSMHLIKNALHGDFDVNIYFNDKMVFFEFENTLFISKLLNDPFPNYNAFIPVDNPNTLFIDKKDLLNSLKRISIFASKSTNQVTFNLDESSLTISSQDLDFSNEATEQLPCTYEGEPVTIGFNSKFFMEVLSIMYPGNIRMELLDYTKPCIILPEEQEEGEHLLLLIMPVVMGY